MSYSNPPRHLVSSLLLGVTILSFLSNAAPAFAASDVWLGISGPNWNVATNWSGGVPMTGDDLIFSASPQTTTVMNASFDLSSITYNAVAPAYTTIIPTSILNLTGAGIVNNSANTQTFILPSTAQVIRFFNSSAAGTNTVYQLNSSNPSTSVELRFFDSATADHATIISTGSATSFFENSATAGSANITNNGANATGGGGTTWFFDTSTAGNATITNNAGPAANRQGTQTAFYNSSSAANSTIIANGATQSGAGAGGIVFDDSSTAANATLIANGGTGGELGGYIFLNSNGGTSRVELFGNGTLTTFDSVTIGSLEGDGQVDTFAGFNTFSVGSNNMSTTFSGVVGGNGAFAKVGIGTLTLSGANTYYGSTTVTQGKLVLNGSLASTSSVTIQDGATLGGSGHAQGSATLQSGGIIAPGDSVGTLRLGSLTWGGGGKMQFDLASTNPAGDHLALDLSLTKGAPAGGFQFNFNDLGATAGMSYSLITFGSQTGFAASDFTFTSNNPNLNGTFTLTSTELDFTVSQVPEPSSLLLLLSVAGAFCAIRFCREQPARG
jgi:autotransporter-associated beta strand protein